MKLACDFAPADGLEAASRLQWGRGEVEPKQGSVVSVS